MENDILIGIEWLQNPDISVSPILGNYIVLINPPIKMGYDFNTVNTSIELIVFYNQEYNISVFASNCAGNRSLVLVDFQFSIGKPSCYFYSHDYMCSFYVLRSLQISMYQPKCKC